MLKIIMTNCSRIKIMKIILVMILISKYNSLINNNSNKNSSHNQLEMLNKGIC